MTDSKRTGQAQEGMCNDQPPLFGSSSMKGKEIDCMWSSDLDPSQSLINARSSQIRTIYATPEWREKYFHYPRGGKWVSAIAHSYKGLMVLLLASASVDQQPLAWLSGSGFSGSCSEYSTFRRREGVEPKHKIELGVQNRILRQGRAGAVHACCM
ncbi:hypothetical protein DL93DRAFT_2094639 [Clavulina sp. PMI_390]|nr:hypothetical protein DL93DRAFT_2094639 [Clavulina sp. PMI_390]